MKKVFLSLAVAAVLLSSCGKEQTQENADHNMMGHGENNGHEGMNTHEGMATMMSHASLDGPVRKSDKAAAILDSYLAIKDALASDNSAQAATSSEAMVKAFAGFDRASLDEKQQASFDKIVEDAREHAENIGENSGKIDHQREHFDALSQDMMNLIAVTGSDRTLYQNHCPMHNDNKGANWLSVSEEIENPYYGSKMLTCGTMENEIVPQ